MIEFHKVFLDTAPIIYFLDEDVHFGDCVERILSGILECGHVMITSTITCTEYLTVPYKTNNAEKEDAFFDFITDCDIPIQPITVQIAKRAAKIRAEYGGFKTMDALQLATACFAGCDVFLTIDKQLRKFKEMKCITVEEWKL